MAKINEIITALADTIKEYDHEVGILDKEVHLLLKTVSDKKQRLSSLRDNRASMYNVWEILTRQAKEEQNVKLESSRTGNIETNFSR